MGKGIEIKATFRGIFEGQDMKRIYLVGYQAYPKLQKFSRFFLLSSSTYSWGGRKVTLSPCISAISPLKLGVDMN